MNNVDKQYIDILKDIIDNGVKKDTRSGQVRSVFDRTMRFDLKEGLPLITTKKVFVKGIIHELLFFLSGKDTIDYLKENNVHIWDGDCERWDKESGTIIGKSYPHQWRRYGATQIIGSPDKEPYRHISNNELMESVDGKVYSSNNYGDYIIIKENGDNTVLIQFLKTKYIKTVRKDKSKNGQVYDPYYPSFMNICCRGNITIDNDIKRKLHTTWQDIVYRCYNNKNDNYRYYGYKGVRLSKTWKCFEYFYNDVIKLDNWDLKVKDWKNYQLDKDIIGNGLLYSKSTCKWVLISENIKKKEEKFEYTVTNGIEFFSFINHVDFIKKNNIKNGGNFRSMLRGERKKSEGWKLVSKKEIINNGIDQIKSIIDTLKNNPDDRRMILTPWNVCDLNEMALPPCHLLVQFYTKEINFNGKKKRELSCSFTMRSNDFCCGNPYNIAQYAMLTYMLCEVCDMIPGELIYHGQDVHVYENHIENAIEQIKRKGSDTLPKLKFGRKINDIDDFKYEDFIIEDYYPDSAIKYQLNVG